MRRKNAKDLAFLGNRIEALAEIAAPASARDSSFGHISLFSENNGDPFIKNSRKHVKRIVYLFLALSFLSLHSQEVIPSGVLVNEQTEEQSPLLSANQMGEFQGGLASGEVSDEGGPFLSVTEPNKNQLYLLIPTSWRGLVIPGLAFRHQLNGRSFFEVAYVNKKQADISVDKYKDFFEVESTKKLGTIYQNILSASYGRKWNIRYGSPYLSFGGGVYFPYINYQETSSVNPLPIVATALGIDFGYGFFDLSLNYLPIQWNATFEYQEGEDKITSRQHLRVVGGFRLGVGYPF